MHTPSPCAQPTRIIHLAVKLAPMAEMQKEPATFFKENAKIDNNVLGAAAALVSSGLLGRPGGEAPLLHVVSCLSTAMLPANAGIAAPVNESTLFEMRAAFAGAASTGYAGAKWHLMSLSMRLAEKTPGLRALALLPSNIFGPGAKCGPSGPLLNALVAKAAAAKADGKAMVVAGTGKPLRHMLFSEDFVRVLLWAMEHYVDVRMPLIVAGKELKVKALAQLAANAVNFTGKISYDGSYPDGPLRRAVSTDKLEGLMPRLTWTPLPEAVAATARSCI